MMIRKLPLMMLFCLLCTIVIEVLIAFIIGIKNKKDFLNICLVNIMTNPIVSAVPFYLNIKYSVLYRNFSLVILEILAIIAEGLVYCKFLDYKKINGFLLSFILNFSSYFLGCLINLLVY